MAVLNYQLLLAVPHYALPKDHEPLVPHIIVCLYWKFLERLWQLLPGSIFGLHFEYALAPHYELLDVEGRLLEGNGLVILRVVAVGGLRLLEVELRRHIGIEYLGADDRGAAQLAVTLHLNFHGLLHG